MFILACVFRVQHTTHRDGGFSLKQLKASGLFTALQLLKVGFPADELKSLGYKEQELQSPRQAQQAADDDPSGQRTRTSMDTYAADEGKRGQSCVRGSLLDSGSDGGQQGGSSKGRMTMSATVARASSLHRPTKLMLARVSARVVDQKWLTQVGPDVTAGEEVRPRTSGLADLEEEEPALGSLSLNWQPGPRGPKKGRS